MSPDPLRIAPFGIACLLSFWTAMMCLRLRKNDLRCADAEVWVILATVYFLLMLMITLKGLGLLHGFGALLRDFFKSMGWYEGRRLLQIIASLMVALVAVNVFIWGVLWIWHLVRRYRLAIGLTGLIVGFGLIRFISLHEVDAWNASAPWVRRGVELVAACGVSFLALLRIRQLKKLLATEDVRSRRYVIKRTVK